MRKSINILRLVLGTVVCCFIVHLTQATVHHVNISAEMNRLSTKESYLIVNSNHISGYALAPESSLSTLFDTFSPPAKSQSKVFFSTTKINEQLLHALYVHYTFYARHLLICFRTIDIIFPFPYFW